MPSPKPITWTYYMSFMICLLVVYLQSVTSSEEYLLQITVYVDESGFDEWVWDTGKSSWNDFERDIIRIFTKAESSFRSFAKMNPPLDIYFEITDIILLENNVANFTTYFKKNVINGNIALIDFSNWAQRQDKKYDLAFLFTGFDIGSLEINSKKEYYLDLAAIGMAHIDHMCHPLSVALLEMRRTVPHAVAHEIAHVFGARHDGQKGYTDDCRERGFVMAPFVQREPRRPMPFSKCSLRMIHEAMSKTANVRCLTDESLEKRKKKIRPVETIKGVPVLDISADELCHDLKGDKWFLLRGDYTDEYGDDFCQNFGCCAFINRTIERYEHGRAPDGLKCGQRKRCYQGKCVNTPNGDPSVRDECPWGDQTLTSLGYKYNYDCQRVKDGNSCPLWKIWCCETCR